MPINRQIPPEKLKVDIGYFVETLEEVHPNPYAHISKKAFYKKVETLKAKIREPITRKKFYLQFAPLVTLLHDEHTSLATPRRGRLRYSARSGRFFPLQVNVDNSRLFVAQDFSNAVPSIAANQQIMTINGVQAATIIDSLQQYVSGASIYYKNSQLEDGFAGDLYTVFGFEGPFEVNLTNRNVILEGVAWDTLQIREKRNSAIAADQTLAYETLAHQIGLLTVSSFAMPLDTFKVFLKEAFTQIQRDNVRHLIIDVRQNGGGSSVLAEAMISYITKQPYKKFHRIDWKRSRQYVQYNKKQYPIWIHWLPFWPYDNTLDEYLETDIGEVYRRYPKEEKPPHRPLRFEGDVYVLSGVDTFSSGVIFVNVIKDYNMAKIIGVETGGSACHFGEVYPFYLPHSKLVVLMSSKHFVRPSGKCTGDGVKPDIVARQTPEATRRGIDVALRRTKELILAGKKDDM